MTNLPPNPLVTALGQELLPPEVSYVDRKGNVQQFIVEEADDQLVANALAADPAVPQLVTFAGFLGGSFEAEDGRTWRLFYLDPKLLTWLVLNEDDIVLHRVIEDETRASANRKPLVRDLIWLKSSASVTDGSGPPRPTEIEAQFLRGDFIGAGDFSASLTGGTFSRATGLLCEVQTPGCCGRRTR
jgi:hypothetical protein